MSGTKEGAAKAVAVRRSYKGEGNPRFRHGMCGSGEYRVWSNMLTRCTNAKRERFKNYGGRGIKVCERWEDFSNFYSDMGPRPSLAHSIERINNDGDYEPGNCCWLETIKQCRNNRRVRPITFQGRTQILADWARELKLPYFTLRSRIDFSGWSVERALTTPAKVKVCAPF